MLKIVNVRRQVNIKLREELTRKVEHYNNLYPERPLNLAAICRDAAEKALEVVLEKVYRESGIKEPAPTNTLPLPRPPPNTKIMKAGPFVSEREENIKKVMSMVAETGSYNKKSLVGRFAVETGLRPATIEGYITMLVDANIVIADGEFLVLVEHVAGDSPPQ